MKTVTQHYRNFLLLCFLGLLPVAVTAQSEIQGQVTDMSTDETLPGVNILVKGTTIGTVTDVEGNYRLSVPENAETLVFSSVGYTSEEVAIDNQTTINLALSPDIQSLQEIVVVGYGTQKKEDLTGSVISVDSEVLNEQQGPKVNVFQALQGVVPGLNISQSGNNAAQDGVNITIRGRNSIKAGNNPLIVLDGVPYSGGLNEIEQSDVQSIEILKDASAAAIYGARGANGVILVTTRQGKPGEPQISYNGSFGVQRIANLPPVLNGEEYWDFATERVGEDVVNQFPTLVENREQGNSTDWVDLGTQDGRQQKHTLSVGGGGDRFRYYLSGTYTDVRGIAVGDDFQQIIARANLSLDITDWLTLSTNTQYTHQDLSGLSADFGGFNGTYFANPLTNAYDEDGELTVTPWPEEPLFANPLSNLLVQDEDINQRLFSNNSLTISFPFVEGLSYRLNTGITYLTGSQGQFYGSNTLEGFVNGGQAFISDTSSTDWIVENILTYQKVFGKHSLNFTGLYSAQNITREQRELLSQRFPSELLTWYQAGLAEVINPSSSYSEQHYVSQMGRINYNYDSKYLLTLTARRDGYSGFGQDKKYGVFPSLALGWNASQEAFLSDVSWLDLLKVRFSVGRNGNQAIDPYETLARLELQNYLTGDNAATTAPGFLPATLSTPTLGWETSNTLNAGFDFGILAGRVQGTIDGYYTRTSDLLLDRAISPIHGITSVTQNIGETENRGIELYLNTNSIQRENFVWNTTFSFSHNQNKITKLYGDGQDDVANNWFIGRSIDANYALVYDGVWQTGEDNSLQPDAEPGDVKVRDVDGDGVIDANEDRAFIGQQNPRYTAGLVNTFTYKNVSLSFSLFSQQGVTRVNPLWDTDVVFLDARRNTIDLNWWGEDNPTNAYPANRNNTNPFDVRFYQDASFVRLRDITLAYRLPERLLQPIGFSQVRIFGNIRNALTFTDWEGLDPELDAQRALPLDRAFIVGLTLGF